MNYFQVQDFFKKMYPGKEIKFEFDDRCHRFHELVYTEGRPNEFHHVENHHVKMTIENQEPIYVPIQPHREVYSWDEIKQIINSK
jgi:hypothetical protein